MTSLGVSRRTQVVRNHHMVIPRRRLSGDTEGKTIIPAKTVLQQIADSILKTPAILAGAISPGEPIPKTLPQVTEEEESSRHLPFWQVPYLPERPFQKLSRRSQRRRNPAASDL
jgi:hypothetical protein